MPKLVDHAARRAEIARALFRLVRREGIHAVSVRTVAAEAGTSPSALRHYFATQDELLGFALQAVVNAVRERLEPLAPVLHGRAGAERVMEQILPLDPERRGEIEVYLAFVTRAQTDERLRQLHLDAEAATHDAVRLAVQLLARAGQLGEGRDVERETARVYPLLDGLALHATLWPERYSAEQVRQVLHRHLDELASPLSAG